MALILSVGMISGCAESDQAGGGADDKKTVIGFVHTGDLSDWRKAHTQSVKEAAKAAGYELKFADGQAKLENQVKAVSSFISQGVDAIIIAPLEVAGWDNVLEKAKKRNIPVLILDRQVEVEDDSLYVTYIGAVIGFTTIFVATLITQHELSPWLAWTIALLVGSAYGAAMGATIHFFKLPAFLVTLAGLFFARGMAFFVTQQSVQIRNDTYVSVSGIAIPFGAAEISFSTMMFLAVLVAMAWVTNCLFRQSTYLNCVNRVCGSWLIRPTRRTFN